MKTHGSFTLVCRTRRCEAAKSELRRAGRYGNLATSNHQQGDGAWVKMRINKGQKLVIGGYVPTGKNFDSLIVGANKDRRNARTSGWSYLGFPFWILIQTRTNAKLVRKRKFGPELESEALLTVPQLASSASRGHATPGNAAFPNDSADTSPPLHLPA
jgi:hypothetical protein